MKGFSEKIYLQLKMPDEDVPVSDQKRILLALETLGYENVTVPLPVLQTLFYIQNSICFRLHQVPYMLEVQ